VFQDYVIVHELLHLRVPNHGKLFKSLLTAYLPGWRRSIQNERASSEHEQVSLHTLPC
jgi:predicted metal-dependent hydrolase